MYSPLPPRRRRSPLVPVIRPSGKERPPRREAPRGDRPARLPAGELPPDLSRSGGSRARCAALPPGVWPLAPGMAAGPPGHPARGDPTVGAGVRGAGCGPGGAEGLGEPLRCNSLAVPAPPGGCGGPAGYLPALPLLGVRSVSVWE